MDWHLREADYTPARLAVPDDASKSTSLSTSLNDHSNSERRGAPRHPFIASAEETDLASGARLSARVSELSLRSEEHTSELQSHLNLVCRLLLEKKKTLQHTSHEH